MEAPPDLDAAARLQLALQAASEQLEREFAALSAGGVTWRERGYFISAEHDAIEGLLFRFRVLHRALWGELDRLGGLDVESWPDAHGQQAQLLVWHAVWVVSNASESLVWTFQDDPVAISKLDEAFYRSRIPAGTYDELRRAMALRARQAVLERARVEQTQFLASAQGATPPGKTDDAAWRALRRALPILADRWAERRDAIDAEHGRLASAVEASEAGDWTRDAQHASDAAGRLARATLFKDLSRLKDPRAHVLRFSRPQKAEILDLLAPGDVILTYTAGYVSDVFIPGVFKHGITYVGGAEPGNDASIGGDVIEAVAEGVKFSDLDRILDTHVNRLAVLRPRLSEQERIAFVSGVHAFVGDPYDFAFDFADASRQVCTEVIYRALDGRGPIAFTLTPRAGHPTLSADDIVRYHLAHGDHFEVLAYAEGEPGGAHHDARLWTGAAAEARLAAVMSEQGQSR